MVELNYTREILAGIPAYVPGKPAPSDSFKVSSNESPFAPHEAIQKALVEQLAGLNRYPDMGAVALREALGERHGVAPAQVHVSTGASAVLSDLVRATVDQGDEVIFAWRSFEAYPIIVQSHGGVGVRVPLTDSHEHDLEAMAQAVTERTRLILLCSPNNPTGVVIGTDALREFLKRVPQRVTVALDEAYIEFAESSADSAALFREFENLAITRTFSKVHGIAGLRLGYAIAHPHLAEALAKVTVPFGANTLAQTAALAALEPAVARDLEARVTWIKGERRRVAEALAQVALGVEMPESQGNFIFLPLGECTGKFVDFAASRGLIIRGYGADGCRITIGEEEANSRTIDVVREFANAARS